MGFTQLDTSVGLEQLDTYLSDKSYILGYLPSQADTVVYEAVKKTPATKFINALRWYNHITSYGLESKKFTGDKKAASAYGPTTTTTIVEDDDDLDLFGSDEEDDAENEKLKAARVAEYNAKKASKAPRAAAKSMVIFDVKPWDDETDMTALQEAVISIQMEGLVWGTKKFVPVGYGIRKLVITCVIVDDLVGTDDLIDKICEFEDFVQSVDISAFNKL